MQRKLVLSMSNLVEKATGPRALARELEKYSVSRNLQYAIAKRHCCSGTSSEWVS